MSFPACGLRLLAILLTGTSASSLVFPRLQAFHIASGMEGHVKYRMRKAIRKWVSRARVRRGLRRQVFQTAQKGKDLLLLLKMMDEADTDDLCNAVLAKDGEGCTPILWAAKKGYTDVVEAFIGAGVRSSDELGDQSLLGQIVNSIDADGNTALHWAARKSHVYVANALMLAGADVDADASTEAVGGKGG